MNSAFTIFEYGYNVEGLQTTSQFAKWKLSMKDNSPPATCLEYILKCIPENPTTKTDEDLLAPFLASSGRTEKLDWPSWCKNYTNSQFQAAGAEIAMHLSSVS